jgi:hypothetical protein
MSYGRMLKAEKRLRREIDEILEQAAAQDAAEDDLYGPDQRGDELPQELRRREDRLRKIAEAKARLEARQAEEDRGKGRRPGDGRKSPRGGRRFKREFGVPPDKEQDNFTDPQSRVMMTQDGYQQCYNAQIAVDSGSQLIVATGLTNNAADSPELVPMVERIETLTGQLPKQVLADAGYRSEAGFQKLEQMGVEAVVSLGREGKKARSFSDALEATRRMAAKLESEEGRGAYRERKGLVEPVVGWIKQRGFRSFSLRGLAKTTGEWDLVCLATNLRRMYVLAPAA